MTPPAYIYGLLDPRSGELRYIGKSNHPARRLGEHEKQARRGTMPNKHLARWLLQLVKAGLHPDIRKIQRVPRDDWQEAERHWIKTFRWAGVNLTNLGDGGEGFSAGYRPSDETRAKMRAAHWSRRGEHPANYLSDEQLLGRVIEAYERMGRIPRVDDVPNNGWIAVARRFGSWTHALELVGIDLRREFSADLRELAGKLGHSPTFSDYRRLGTYTTARALRLFGNWNAAITSAGLRPNGRR